jgi:Mg2+ and Co2+ transporter CorA
MGSSEKLFVQYVHCISFRARFLSVQVKESVDDTEDYVKIRLDDHQNTLLNVVLTISCLVIGIFIVVTGIFGMNISIPLFTEGTDRDFWSLVGISSAASIVLSASIIGWCKYTNLI